MRGSLCLLAFVTACGGASDSDLFGGGGSSGSSGSAPSTNPPAGTTTADAGSEVKPKPDPKPCVTVTYYRDDDKDGYGGTVTQAACASPGEGWATKGGDCADDDAAVFPGQTAYFHEAYSKGGGTKSFDYDCNTKEEQKLPQRKTASICVVVGNACTGDGFIPAQRIGTGIDPLCGASQYQTCTFKPGGIAQCETKIVTAEVPVSCH